MMNVTEYLDEHGIEKKRYRCKGQESKDALQNVHELYDQGRAILEAIAEAQDSKPDSAKKAIAMKKKIQERQIELSYAERDYHQAVLGWLEAEQRARNAERLAKSKELKEERERVTEALIGLGWSKAHAEHMAKENPVVRPLMHSVAYGYGEPYTDVRDKSTNELARITAKLNTVLDPEGD
jgi:hypothetical protein